MKELDDLKFDSSVRYFGEHTWVRMEGNLAFIGISDYAQDYKNSLE
jgi:glycine cleavage system H lipoate-binding protein